MPTSSIGRNVQNFAHAEKRVKAASRLMNGDDGRRSRSSSVAGTSLRGNASFLSAPIPTAEAPREKKPPLDLSAVVVLKQLSHPVIAGPAMRQP